MSFKATREGLKTALQEALGKRWVVIPDSSDTDDITTKPVLYLQRQTVNVATVGHYTTDYALLMMCPTNTTEDGVEDYLDELLIVLTEDVKTLWRDASRATFDDKYPGYSITLTGTSERNRD